MYFFRKYKDRMIVIGVAIILILIIGFTNKERLNLTKFEKTFGNLLSPISKASFNIKTSVTNFFINIKQVSTLKDDNTELEKRVLELESENRDLQNVIGMSDYLKNEARLLQVSKHNFIQAQIISKEPGNWYNRFLIDKGSDHGVKKGDTIVTGFEVEQNLVQEGIVGRVVDVGPKWAKVITIIDEINKISFKNIRTQDGGILNGDMDGVISGYLFDSKSDVIVGDKLYTSGLGLSFVKDIYIGEVEEVIDDEEDLMKRIIIKPAINFKRLQRVLIISD
jgi:rod shape-determining protein MreC